MLTRSYLETGDTRIITRQAAKRWPRLAGPVLAATLFSWALFALGLYRYADGAAITQSPYLATFANGITSSFVPSLSSALEQGAFLTFFRGDAGYDTSLWTMRYELLGSFVAFGFAVWVRLARPDGDGVRLAVLLVVLLMTRYISAYYCAFPVGVMLAEILTRRRFAIKPVAAIFLVVLALYLAGYNWDAEGAFSPIRFVHGWRPNPLYGYIVGSVALLVAAECSPPLHRLLSGRWARALGSLSFPLYLVHVPILCSAGCAVLLWAARSQPYPVPEILATGTTLIVSLLVAALGAKASGWWLVVVNRVVDRGIEASRRWARSDLAS